MLLLTRFPGEEIEIIAERQATITVTVVDVMSNGVVKLGFDGPDHVRFLRDNARRRRPRRYTQGEPHGQEEVDRSEGSEIERQEQGRGEAGQAGQEEGEGAVASSPGRNTSK